VTDSTASICVSPSISQRTSEGRIFINERIAERERLSAWFCKTFESEKRKSSIPPSKGAPTTAAPSAARIMSKSTSS